jgi:C4-dicarboxylate-specific signal transduction histidine kinase
MDNMISVADSRFVKPNNVIKLEEKFERFRTALPFLRATQSQQGSHICLLYDNDAVLKTFCRDYITQGLKNGERVICLFDKLNRSQVLEILDMQIFDGFPQIMDNLIVKNQDNSCFMNSVNQSDTLAVLFSETINSFNREENKKTRIITEMSIFFGVFSQINELFELEAKINERLTDDVSLLCLYNTKVFESKFLISVLQAHPYCAFDNMVFKNLNYIPPEQYLSNDKDKVFLNAIMDCMRKSRDLEQDLSDKSLLIEELMTLEKKLMQKNKELDDFTSIVSHELKNPLNLIKAYLEEMKEPEAFQVFAGRLSSKVNDSLSMIDNMLQLSRAGLTIREKQKVELDMMIRSVFYCLKPSEMKAKLNIAGNFPPVYGDLARLEQVFTNLISNSMQHRDPEKQELEIEVKFKQHDGEIIILYKDNGLGIKKDRLNRLFEPGFTTRDNGNGFGLVIVKKIIEAHGGDIRANSLGEKMGASFIIKLPL